MKAVLVIDDMPDICYECPCYDHEGGICQASHNWKTDRENGCPLRPLPKKEIVLERKINGVTANYLEMAEARIRNRVIDEILGKGETE